MTKPLSPASLSPEQIEMLHEASDILCAANHSLKTFNGIVEAYISLKGEDDGYTLCDQSGDYYCLRKALALLQEFIRVNGLQMDDVR
jgi:hypothetical protein